MKKISLTLFALLIAVFAFAQPKIKFDQTTYDFGQIHEEGGKVTARFNFTNIGTEDLLLQSVRPGCGCTAANYTKTAIAPGQQGFIDATYNPAGRPGSFNKNIKVTTNEPEMNVEKPAPHMLFIKGAVTPKPKTAFERDGYNIGKGMVRFKTNTQKLDLLSSESHNDTFLVKNFWDKDVNITLKKSGYISEVSRTFGPSIKAGEEGSIVIKYDASKRNDFGTLKDIVVFNTNDSIEQDKEIYYQINIKEDFSKLSKGQLKKAPVANFDKTFLDFGNVKIGTTATQVIKVSNDGKSDLIIRKIDPTHASVSVKCEKTVLKKGESTDITFVYDAKRKKGKQTSAIFIITNDPNNSQITINTKAENLQ